MLKREISRRYLDGEFSYRIAAEEYGLPNKDTVKEFVKWYRREQALVDNLSLGPQKKKGLGEDSSTKACDPVSLQAENDLLRQQLSQERRKVDAWKALVDVANEELGIDIVKKSVPKPSQK